MDEDDNEGKEVENKSGGGSADAKPSFLWYLLLSFLRAASLGATNLALRYLNFPAAMILKSCRTIFVMAFGVLSGKRYKVE